MIFKYAGDKFNKKCLMINNGDGIITVVRFEWDGSSAKSLIGLPGDR